MNQTEVESRYNPRILCNGCKGYFNPYPSSFAPVVDEVKCPTCGEKKILYYGEDSTIIKMILSTYGVNKDLNERIDKVEGQMGSLKEMVKTSLDDARAVMTEALIRAINEPITKHENQFHNFGGKSAKP